MVLVPRKLGWEKKDRKRAEYRRAEWVESGPHSLEENRKVGTVRYLQDDCSSGFEKNTR